MSITERKIADLENRIVELTKFVEIQQLEIATLDRDADRGERTINLILALLLAIVFICVGMASAGVFVLATNDLIDLADIAVRFFGWLDNISRRL